MTDDDMVTQLIELVAQLYADTEGFLEREDDAQLWYNRGYANGMVKVLDEQGYNCRLRESVDPDPEEIVEPQRLMPWGKAYLHGVEMGSGECSEVLERREQ